MNKELVKLSYPGFSLKTEHLNVIYYILSKYICSNCLDQIIKSNDDTILDKIYKLLDTHCGAEFILDENPEE